MIMKNSKQHRMSPVGLNLTSGFQSSTLPTHVFSHVSARISGVWLKMCTNNRDFPKLTDLTFLLFLYKIGIMGFQNQQKKLPPLGIELTTPTPLLEFRATLTTEPPRHLLNRISLNWTWIISGSIEHDFKRVWKFETGMDWQIGWVCKVAGILIVGWWVQYPVEAIFFADFGNFLMSLLNKPLMTDIVIICHLVCETIPRVIWQFSMHSWFVLF